MQIDCVNYRNIGKTYSLINCPQAFSGAMTKNSRPTEIANPLVFCLLQSVFSTSVTKSIIVNEGRGEHLNHRTGNTYPTEVAKNK